MVRRGPSRPVPITAIRCPARLVAGLFAAPIVVIAGAEEVSARGGQATAPATRPVLRAAPADPVPMVDGDILGDPAWQGVEGADALWQESPNEGAPASEQTSVRVLFTNDTLYVGVTCYDRDPSGIIVADSRRDTPLDDTDSFQIILDTYRDGLNGFVFGTNPAGIEYDGQVTNEGQGGGGLGGGQSQQTGAGGGFNLNWDAA